MCHEASGRGAAGVAGHRQGHVRPRRLGGGRPDLRDGRQRGVQRAAHADDARRGLSPGRRDRPRQPARRGGARARTIIPHEFAKMATLRATPDRHAERAAARSAGDLAFLRGVAKAVLERAAAEPEVLDRLFLERYTTGFEEYRSLVRRDVVGRTSCTSSRRARGADARRRAPLPRRVADDRQLVPRPDPAGARGRHRSARSSTCCSCAATSAAKARARRRSAGTATCRATARAASTIARPKRSSPGSTRSAAIDVAACARSGHGAHDRGDARAGT